MTVNGHIHEARFWYDGKYLNNAKEDAAEMALNWLDGRSGYQMPWCAPAAEPADVRGSG